MRRILVVTWAAASCFNYAALATDFNVAVEADGCSASTITVGPACEILYRVIGELGDTANKGLAIVIFDLEFDGGALAQADEPTEFPMLNFVPPYGFSGNPDGCGGTPQSGKLIQIGGAQNVFNHSQWPCEDDGDCPDPSTCDSGLCTPVPGLPVGTLITDVAVPGSPVVLVTGTLTAPTSEGTYVLRVSSLTANVVEQDATGDPFWATQAAGVGAITNLSITVQDGAVCCGEVPEACCMFEGSCAMVDPDYCAGQPGSVPQGPDSTCEGDVDGDGLDGTCGDECPEDTDKTSLGICGCGASDSDGDGDTVPDCVDQCPGEDDLADANEDGIPDCLEQVPIPALSEWGLAILALSLLAAGKVYFGRRRHVRCSGKRG